jgi:group II intron reverse transcriptase/maturase
MSGRYSPGSVSTRLCRIAELARRRPEIAITTLAHHIDLAWLWEAYEQTAKDKAAGVDGITAEEYSEELQRNLESLLDRFKTGSYKAPPVRRVHIPKGKGKTRPIGIPTLEDKVLQRAVSMVLEAVYEQDFLDCSYGFRSGRSPHQALNKLWKQLMDLGGGWVLDVDVQSFFDALDHRILRSILDTRVRDGVIRRAIDKWLKAGVMEDGQHIRPEKGTPQGGVVSPILANIYLHEVVDTWFEQDAKPRMRGACRMVRFADDMVMVFEHEEDARRVHAVLPKRLAKYGLTMHPEKTRLVCFKKPKGDQKPKNGKGPRGGGGTFDFLGFTHYWRRSRKSNWVVGQKTARARLQRAVAKARKWCWQHRHWRVKNQYTALAAKVKGHCSFYGITGNSWSIQQFRTQVERAWKAALGRRSQRAKMTWSRFKRLKARYKLPAAIAVHSKCRCAANP